jgi:hyperosmotically inducible protein
MASRGSSSFLSGVWLILALAATSFSAQPQTSPSSTSAPPSTAADNTRVNQQDRSGQTMTPTSQPNDRTDIILVAAVRRAVVNNKSLSDAARNIKIMAANGAVTLRGVVKNQDEKASVDTTVKGVSGVDSVDNELTIQQ